MAKKFKKVNTEFFIFDKIGQSIEGIYKHAPDVNTVNGVAQACSIVNEETGEVKRMLVSSGMQALADLPEGSYVRVTYQGEETNPKTNRKYKAFDVEVAEEE